MGVFGYCFYCFLVVIFACPVGELDSGQQNEP